jgi:phenylalanyl-tRNA synthetase alpha chain
MLDAAEIDRLRAEFIDALSHVAGDDEFRAVRDRYLARKGGVIANLMRAVAAAAPADRPALGRLANEFKTEIEARLADRRAALDADRPAAGAVDVTLPGRVQVIGHRHPLTIVREQMETVFLRMGYQIVDGPEAEDDYHTFEALNIPPEHPARDMQDTLFLAEPLRQSWVPSLGVGFEGPVPPVRPATLLRTHTSPMQIRHMETHQPPIRIIAAGRVYRHDNPDLTHSPMFQQIEGLVVGEGVTMGDLKGTLVAFVREMFRPDARVMFRPSFFPYTEPSADVFMGCAACGGSGCAMCKRTGWIEVLGCGMVHPAVFEAVGYDPERYTGFAFGIGIERIAILKHAVDDIRLFYDNDVRFLEQFRD